MTRAFRRSAAGLLAVGAVAFAAACGGGDDSSALSADELRTQADAICADINSANNGLSNPTSEAEALPFLKSTRENNAEGLTRLKELRPPEELADDWSRALTLQEELSGILDDAIARIEGGESAETVMGEVGSSAEAKSNELDEIASRLGLKVCGDGDGGEEPTTTATTATDTTATTLTEPTTTAAPATTEATTTEATPSAGGEVGQYLEDAQAAAGALTSFGQLLQSVTNPDQLRAKASEAQETLSEFDAAIARMDGYTLENAQLERQRSGLVEEGPKVSDVLRRFVDAASNGDASAVQSLLPEVMQALQAFSRAATDVS